MSLIIKKIELSLTDFKNLPHQKDQSIIFLIIRFVRKKYYFNLVDRAIFLSHKLFHDANSKIVKQILLDLLIPADVCTEKMKRVNALFLTRERRANEQIRLRNRFTVVSHVNRAGLDFLSRLSGTWITVRPISEPHFLIHTSFTRVRNSAFARFIFSMWFTVTFINI